MTPLIKSISFVKSSPDYKSCPTPEKHEYAFAGRSNVGKSSLINMLARHKGLAKTSGVPGKTQLINHYLIDDGWYLVDLPGYGYAKTSKKNRELFQKMLQGYLLNRNNLVSVFALIDCRIPPQKSDISFMNFMVTNGVPFALVFTKTDKLGPLVLSRNIENYKHTLLEIWEDLPPIFITSSEKSTGGDALIEYINMLNLQIQLKKRP